MGSKTIIFLGVLLSALYLYFCISKYAVTAPVATNVVEEVKTVEQAVVSPEPVVVVDIEPVAIAIPPAIEEDEVVQNANERISTPAFGFMAGAEKNQIVALMSDNDEGGLLAEQIEAICQKHKCSKDMRYETDIIDAPWQKETVIIIKLLTDGSIENGSLFIESNVLKVEGTIKDQKTQDSLNDILNSIKSDTFKVENHSKPSSDLLKKSGETKKVEPVKIETVEVETVKVEIPEKEEVVKPVVKEVLVKKVVPKVEPKPVVKKIIPKPKPIVSKPVAVPAPVMETTLDAEARVRAILSEIRDSSRAVGVVAEPHMETTAE